MVDTVSRSLSRKKTGRKKSFFISGYAVTVRGYTRNAQVTVIADNRQQAIICAVAKLNQEGLTHFKALKVLEITTPLFSIPR
ncbi:hypothetical protein LU604_21320 [Erwinia tracheiphila]|nr:hypothetical protein [Erwinia tracheiphila]UIA82923.1 hypothetical protein LU604_21320 [Erwinia tracheiphila]